MRRRSERQGLGAPGDLGVPVAAQRVHGGARQRVVGAEEPLEGLLVAEAAVLEHGDQPGQVLEDGAVLEEVRRDPAVAAAGDGHELVLARSEEHTSELQSRQYLVCRLLLEKKNKN